jgi:hypothetical protein
MLTTNETLFRRVQRFTPSIQRRNRAPIRGLKRHRTVSIEIRAHVFVQKLRRGHYELGVEVRPAMTVAAPYDELALAI